MNVLMRIGKKTRISLAVTAALGLVAGGASVATAVGGGSDPHRVSGQSSAPLISAQTTGGLCRMGYDTETSIVTPPDDSTTDNVAAATVTVKKPCRGGVIGQFTSETGISSGGFIHLDMRATCIGTGGYTNPCTVGAQAFASPGHTFFSTNPGGIETHAMTMVWSGLPPGQWKFEVLPGGNGTAYLDFRSFIVQAFSGG